MNQKYHGQTRRTIDKHNVEKGRKEIHVSPGDGRKSQLIIIIIIIIQPSI